MDSDWRTGGLKEEIIRGIFRYEKYSVNLNQAYILLIWERDWNLIGILFIFDFRVSYSSFWHLNSSADRFRLWLSPPTKRVCAWYWWAESFKFNHNRIITVELKNSIGGMLNTENKTMFWFQIIQNLRVFKVFGHNMFQSFHFYDLLVNTLWSCFATSLH